MRTAFKSGFSVASIALISALLTAASLAASLSGCSRQASWHNVDISGSLPALDFDMVRGNDGKEVTAANYRGKVTLLYFGYTYCPDVCPTTLSNLSRIVRSLGPDAKSVRVLFVTVDPNRDTLAALKQYADAFAPAVDTLRGTPNEIAALARRYRVAYSVKPEAPGQSYEVTHSSSVFAFDRQGAARLLVTSLSTDAADREGTAEDLRRLIGSKTG